jgi:hypothetical protein
MYQNWGGALVHERVVMMAANCLLDDMDWAPENKVFAEIRIGLDKNEGGQYEASAPPACSSPLMRSCVRCPSHWLSPGSS